jgi:hypothetical protein
MFAAKAGEQMMRCCAIVIAAMAAFSLNGAIGQASFGASRQGKDPDRANPSTEPHPATNPNVRKPVPGGNPLWGIPISLLSATRERPIFRASRHPPAPPDHPNRLPKPHRRHRPERSNLLSHSWEPRSANRKMSRSFSTRRRKTSFVSMSAKRPRAGICVRLICGQ